MYAALTLYRVPETWKPGSKRGKQLKDSLRQALTTLNVHDDTVRFEMQCSHKVVKQMRQDMQQPIRTLRIEPEPTPATIATLASANHEPTHVSEGSGTSGAGESSKGSALEVGNPALELHGLAHGGRR